MKRSLICVRCAIVATYLYARIVGISFRNTTVVLIVSMEGISL